MRTTLKPLHAALAALGLAALPLAGQAQEPEVATATLEDADGNPAGIAEFHEWPAGVLIDVQLEGLAPGEHGIHIHEFGNCQPDFAAAGGHFAPGGQGHGFNSPDGPHAGDLPNIFVTPGGAAAAHFLNPRITLGEGANSLFDEDGAALIVHANPDTYGEEAGAGARVACGVITPGR